MNQIFLAIALLTSIAMSSGRAAEAATMEGRKPMLTYDDIRSVAPQLAAYTQGRLLDEVWKRPGLSPRDRSIVTLAALIARNQTIEMPYHFDLALDNGVKPREISEIIAHLAFYAGWANAMSARRSPRTSSRRATSAPISFRLFRDAAADRRGRRGEACDKRRGAVRKVLPGVVQYTTDVLFRDLWLRPDLAPRDRSLVTLSALIANGQTAQLTPHLNRAMDNGLTQTEASEAITQLAFYVGWPNVFSAMPVAKDVFEKRPHRWSDISDRMEHICEHIV